MEVHLHSLAFLLFRWKATETSRTPNWHILHDLTLTMLPHKDMKTNWCMLRSLTLC